MVKLFAERFQASHGTEIMALTIESSHHGFVFRYINPANRVLVCGFYFRIFLVMDNIRLTIFTAKHGLEYSVSYINKQHPDKKSDHMNPFVRF